MTVDLYIDPLPVARGCGKRKQDGIYWELGFGGPGGKTIEEYLFDPPMPVAEDLLKTLPHIGVQMIERKGVYHLIDRIGKEFYPYATDFIQEVEFAGLSRRLSPTLRFDLLTPASRILMVHDRGYLLNHDDVKSWTCPLNKTTHHQDKHPLAMCCLGMLYEVLDESDCEDGDTHRSVRRMPSFTYEVGVRTDDFDPVYAPAYIASFPASRLVVVSGDKTAELMDKISVSSIPTAEVPA